MIPPDKDKRIIEDVLDVVDALTARLFAERKQKEEGECYIARDEQVFTPDDMFDEDEER